MSAKSAISTSVDPVFIGSIDLVGFASSFFTIVIAILSHIFKKERLILPVLICGITFSLVATALFSFSYLSIIPDSGMTGSWAIILQSIGSVLVSALWIDLYASLNPIRAAFAYAATSLASVALMYIVEGCSPDRTVATLTALPVLTGICLVLVLRKDGKSFDKEGKTRLILPIRRSRSSLPTRFPMASSLPWDTPQIPPMRWWCLQRSS